MVTGFFDRNELERLLRNAGTTLLNAPLIGGTSANDLRGLYEQLDRPRGAAFAAAEAGNGNPFIGLGRDPAAVLRGWREPEDYGGGDILRRAGMGDEDLPGLGRFGLSSRDVIGGIADIGLDPLNLVPIGKAARVAGTVGKRATRDATEEFAQAGIRTAEPVVDEAVDKLLGLVREAKPALRETQALRRAELRTRAGRVATELERGSGEAAYLNARAQLRGELPKANFEPIRPALTQLDIDGFFGRIHAHPKLRPFEKIVTDTALSKVLGGELPQRSEIAALERVFGSEFAKVLLAKRSRGEQISEFLLDAVNVPRALQSSWDASAPLRQGIMLSAGHPIAGLRGVAPMFKAMLSEQSALASDDIIRSRPWAQLAEQAGVYRAPLTGVATELTEREEAFMSRLVTNLPGPLKIISKGVRGSERGYITYLNKLRDDVFGGVVSGWDEAHLTPENLERLGTFINAASGRGELGALENFGPSLNAAFFSPRFFLSRIQTTGQGVAAWADLGKSLLTREAFNPVSKEIAKDTAAFYVTGITALGMLKASGLADVEMDPRSSDFGKVRIGPTRYDFWAGNQQIARFVANLVTGERKSTRSGNVYPANRLETVGRFLQSKLAPAPGFLVDALRGESAMGDTVDLSGNSIRTQAWNRLAPFFINDLVESLYREGAIGGFKALPGALGVGYQEYDAKTVGLDRAAEAMFGRPYYALEPFEKEAVNVANPELAREVSDEAIAAGGAFGRAEELKRKYFEEQKASDARYAAGGLSQKQWRDQYHDRQLELRARRDEVLRGAGVGSDESTLLGRYFKAIDEATRADGSIDWEIVDAWRAALTTEEDASIDRNTGLGGTPKVQEHRATARALAKSGYWDLRDGAWETVKKRLAGRNKLVDQADSLEEYRELWVEQRTAQLAKRIPDPEVARARAELEFQSSRVKRGLDTINARARNTWIKQNRALAQRAIEAGYLSPGRATLRAAA